MPKNWTIDEHRVRHGELHQALDELVADFISHHSNPPRRPSDTTIHELMIWSCQQAEQPDPLASDEHI